MGQEGCFVFQECRSGFLRGTHQTGGKQARTASVEREGVGFFWGGGHIARFSFFPCRFMPNEMKIKAPLI